MVAPAWHDAFALSRVPRGWSFTDHGPLPRLAALRSFVERLPQVAGIRRAKLSTTVSRSARLGLTHLAISRMEIVPVDGAPIVVHGHCEADTTARARAIAQAEVIERLGLTLLPVLSGCPAGTWDEDRLDGLSPSTNGCAVHHSSGAVKVTAMLELLERDRFLVAWYGGERIPVLSRQLAPDLERGLRERGWIVRAHVWRHDRVPCDIAAVSLVRATPRPDRWNFFFGTGSALSRDRAVARALEEALRFLRYYIRSPIETGVSLDRSALGSALGRLVMAQNPAWIAAFLDRLTPTTATTERRVSRVAFVAACQALPDVRFVALPLPRPLVTSTYCLKARCDALQDLDYELPPRFNRARIGAVRPALPHPIA